MRYDPRRHHRRPIRLQEYDYSSAGAYFVTICAHKGACSLGDIIDNETCLSPFGWIVAECWEDLPNHYPHVILDAFVVMPNHIHGMIVLDDTAVGAGLKPAPTKRHGLSEIVRAFKTFSARRINIARNTQGIPFWQRNYYEHIIRNERSYMAIRDYIFNNPVNWHKDRLHPHAPGNQFNRHWR
jgi:REP element-mobilizing transposase RayT